MVIADVVNAIKQGKHVIIEDPINGSKFIDESKSLIRTYILHNVYENGEYKLDISKVRKFSINKEDDSSFITFGKDIVFPFDDQEDLIVLTKVNYMTDEIVNIMKEKFNKKTMDTIYISNIYQVNIVYMRDITPNIAVSKYPYIFNETKFVDGVYKSEVKCLYNCDVLVPKTIYVDRDNTYIRPALSSLSYISKYMDHPNMQYVLNGEYIRTQGTVIRLVDIFNGIFLFRDVLDGEDISLDAIEAGETIINSELISKQFICVKIDKENEYLFYYKFASDKHKADYNKDKLEDIYNSILKNRMVEDSPLYIVNGNISAVYTSIEDIRDDE